MAGYAIRGVLIAGAVLTAAACSSYPTEPRYSTRVDGGSPQSYPGQAPYPPASTETPPPPPPVEAPPPLTAPIARIEGGALPSAGSSLPPASSTATPVPVAPQVRPTTQASSTPAAAGSRYVIQPGDTISGVGRRFRTPVQTLIDLNALGPQGAIRAGQFIILPTTAMDVGPDPYATGPAPAALSGAGATPAAAPTRPLAAQDSPPPAPARPAPRPATPAPPAASSPGAPGFQWPVRGDILRRFGPVSLGERNNGINIGAPAGSAVSASLGGRVAYVGDAIPGAGTTVLIMHRDGWRTVYSHLGSTTVNDGADVRAGQQIGTVGLTAGDGRPSMHFETRKMQGDEAAAVDPLTVLPR